MTQAQAAHESPSLRGFALPRVRLSGLVAELGGVLHGAFADAYVERIAPAPPAPREPTSHALWVVPVLTARALRGLPPGAACIYLVTPALESALGAANVQHDHHPQSVQWVHPLASYVMAKLLERVATTTAPAIVAHDAQIEVGVVLCAGVVVGPRVVIGANSVVGRAGFGFTEGPDGMPYPIPHLGGVRIEEGASIGACCTVDAGVFEPTRIGRHVHLDSHVHVGHNVDVGDGTVVAAQSGFGGSARIGRGVQIGGQVGIADHVVIGDGAKIAAKSGVIGDVPAGAVWAGYPAVPRASFFRGAAWLYKKIGKSRLYTAHKKLETS